MTAAAKRPTLYDIAQDHREIIDILIQTDGELTPELESQLDSILRGGKDKIDAAAAVWRRLVAEGKMVKEEEGRLKIRREAIARDADNLRSRMLIVIDEVFSGKLKTPFTSVWSQTTPPTVQFNVAPDADLGSIGKAYPGLVRVKQELDLSELQRRHKAGESIPDAVSAEDKPGTHFLQIR
jgi:hypothetical protein